MANIEINNLGLAGSELFNDSESFMNELNDQEMWGVQGGLSAVSGAVSSEVASLTGALSGDVTSAAPTAGTLGGLSLSGISGISAASAASAA